MVLARVAGISQQLTAKARERCAATSLRSTVVLDGLHKPSLFTAFYRQRKRCPRPSMFHWHRRGAVSLELEFSVRLPNPSPFDRRRNVVAGDLFR